MNMEEYSDLYLLISYSTSCIQSCTYVSDSQNNDCASVLFDLLQQVYLGFYIVNYICIIVYLNSTTTTVFAPELTEYLK